MSEQGNSAEKDRTIAGHFCGQLQRHAAHTWNTPQIYGAATFTSTYQCAGLLGAHAEGAEAYTVADITAAFENHASPDDWGVPSFYRDGLLAALRGEYTCTCASGRGVRDCPQHRVTAPADNRSPDSPTEGVAP